MKVLLLTNVYPNAYGRSDGVFVQDQVKMLESKGNKVDVIYIDLRSVKKRRKWGSEEYLDGETRIFHYSVPCGPIPIVLEFLHLVTMQIALFLYFKKQEHPDVIHGHFYINGFGAKKIKERYNVKYVLTEHSSELYERKIGKLHKFIMKNAYEGVDCLISVSDALRHQIEKYTSRKIEVIPNVLAKDFCKGTKLQSQEFTFLCIGHVIETKGMKNLVKSFGIVQAHLENVKLVIVGDGYLKAELEKYASDKSLNIEFKGEVVHNDIPEICRKSDCFVLPSEKETFGVSYIEALACGLPVVATRCGGPEEFVNQDNGLLIPVNDEDALVKAMIYMYENYASYDGEKISKRTLEKYGFDNIAERLTQIYLMNDV